MNLARLLERISLRWRFLIPLSLIIGTAVLLAALQFARSEEARTQSAVAGEIGHQREALLAQMDTIDRLVAADVRTAMHVLRDQAARQGAPGIAGTANVGGRVVPGLTLGGQPLAGSYVLVDRVKELTGSTATVFVRQGEDFVRVTTNVMKDDRRAVGTLLDPKGAAVAALREGKPFYGLVDILGAPYLTGYEPMRDARGEVVGAWYVGYSLALGVLADAVQESKFLASGFAAVMDRNGAVRFHSGHVDDARVAGLLANPDGWVTDKVLVPAWGYQIVTAYPQAEVAAVARERSRQVLLAGFVGWALVMGLIDVMLQLFVTRPLGGEPEYARRICQQIAAGDLSEPVRVRRGSARTVLAAMRDAQESVRSMAADTRRLVEYASQGQLSERADPTRHQGEFRGILEGVNATLDAVVAPLEVAADCMARIGRGDIPEPIRQDFRGEFNAIKSSLNQGIDSIRALVDDANRLAEAAVRGELGTRADASRHHGDYRRIVDGVNRTLDAVIGPLQASKTVMLALAEGDLTHRIEGSHLGEFAVLQHAVNDSLDRLNGLVGEIKRVSETLGLASHEISNGNASLAQRTDEQATSLERTHANMDDLSQSVRENAENADRASALASRAAEVAGLGGQRVRDVVATMNGISTNSRRMTEITATIDAIAFQTNILALNAAVEAARAGEQGRGFAVVAGEVRALAQRAATAAGEIRELISHSTETVSAGVRLVEETGGTMDQIVESTQQVTSIVAAIANSSQRQSTDVAQVTTAVAQIDDTTQQNAALVEESAAAAESLADQARTLVTAVGRFRTVLADAPSRRVA